MMTYFDRTPTEQEIIRKAYDFEVNAIETGDCSPNPYLKAIKTMGLWEALNEAIEEAYK